MLNQFENLISSFIELISVYGRRNANTPVLDKFVIISQTIIHKL